MTNTENVELCVSLCTICDWRPSVHDDPSQNNVDNLEKWKENLLARALMEKLPQDFTHVICKPQSNEYTESSVCVLRTNCKSKEQVEAWVSAYSVLSGFQWDLQPRAVSFNRKMKELFRCKYVCREPTYTKIPPVRQPEIQICSASITVVVKSQHVTVSDEHLNRFPTVVRLRGDHTCLSKLTLDGIDWDDSTLYLPESEDDSKDGILQTSTLAKENGMQEVKKGTSSISKRGTDIAVKVDVVNPKGQRTSDGKEAIANNSSFFTKENKSQEGTKKGSSIKREISVSKDFGIGAEVKVEAVNIGQESYQLTTNNLSGHSLRKETSKKDIATKVKVDAPTAVYGRSEVKKYMAMTPFILSKENGIQGAKMATTTGKVKLEGMSGRLEGKSHVVNSSLILVKVNRAQEVKNETTATKKDSDISAAVAKRKCQDTNEQSVKSKKARGVLRKPCDRSVLKQALEKKTLPKKTALQNKVVPLVHVKEFSQQSPVASNLMTLVVPISAKQPPKAALEMIPDPTQVCLSKFDNLFALIDKFDNLFAEKHDPSTALATHIIDLQLSHGDAWLTADCPDLDWCQSYFSKVVTDPVITTPQSTMHSLTGLFELHGKASDTTCRMERLPDGGFVGILVTPLMKRNADTNPAAAGVNYVLPYLGYTSQLFLVMCDSEGGGLPLAIVITSNVTPAVMPAAAKLLRAHTSLSPRQWLVPDMPALVAALRAAFPDSRVSLGLSLLLKDAWLYALRTSSRIPDSHQVLLYQHVLQMIRCPCELELVYHLNVALRSGGGVDSYADYLNALHARRVDWVAYLREPAFRENALETELAVAKAAVLSRLHDFDTVHLVHFALTRLDQWYEMRVRSLHSGANVDYPVSADGVPDDIKLTVLCNGITLVQVEPDGTDYLVNDSVGGCSCLKGQPGWCRHQLAVSLVGKVDRLPDVSLEPEGQPVQVDASMPEIFPLEILAFVDNSSTVAGKKADAGAVPGKRVRKLPPKLQMDLGHMTKKQKAEGKDTKKKSVAGAAVHGVRDPAEYADQLMWEETVSIHAVEKQTSDGRKLKKNVPKLKDSSHAGNCGVRTEQGNGRNERVQEVQAATQLKEMHVRAKKHCLASKKERLPVAAFSTQKRTQAQPDGDIFELMKKIAEDLPACYARNPSLRNKIQKFYCTIHRPLPVPKPQPIQKPQQIRKPQPIRKPQLIRKPKQILKQYLAASLASTTPATDIEMDVKIMEIFEENESLLVKEPAVREPEDVIVNPCYVSLLPLEIGKYTKPDGSYWAHHVDADHIDALG